MSRRVALALSPTRPLVSPLCCQSVQPGAMAGVIGLAAGLFEFWVGRVVINSSRPDSVQSHSGPQQFVRGRVVHRIQLDDVQMRREVADNLRHSPVALWLPGGFSVTHVAAAMWTASYNEHRQYDAGTCYFRQLDLLALDLETVDGLPTRQCPRPATITPGRSYLAPDWPRPVVAGPRPFNPGRRRVIVCSAAPVPSPGDRGAAHPGY